MLELVYGFSTISTGSLRDMGSKYRRLRYFQYAPVAQWIEQWIPNPCAASSILAGGTITRHAR